MLSGIPILYKYLARGYIVSSILPNVNNLYTLFQIFQAINGYNYLLTIIPSSKYFSYK